MPFTWLKSWLDDAEDTLVRGWTKALEEPHR
jgi:hypothetical protein